MCLNDVYQLHNILGDRLSFLNVIFMYFFNVKFNTEYIVIRLIFFLPDGLYSNSKHT